LNTNFETFSLGVFFFLSREVPRDSIEFVVKAFGGKVGWDGSGLDESDTSITHQVTDRTSQYYMRQAALRQEQEKESKKKGGCAIL